MAKSIRTVADIAKEKRIAGSGRHNLRMDGHKCMLKGDLPSSNSDGVAKLALAQPNNVRVTLPTLTEGKLEDDQSYLYAPADVADMVRAAASATVESK